VPEADLRLAEMEALHFNAFFFAVDMMAALREAGKARSRARRS
jgi:hypothetical protein